MNDLSLIALVRRYEELYNLQHSGYSNHLRRDNIWEEIGNQLSENGMQCRERWQRIRENFRKALNLRKTKRDQGAENIKPPKFYKELSFLLPYLNDEDDIRSKLGNLLDTQSPNSPADGDSIGEGDSQLSDSSLSNVTKYIPAPKRRYTQPTASNDHQISSQNMPQQSVSSTKTDTTYASLHSSDTLIDFFLIMARTVKTFPLSKQLQIKGQLFQMVHNVELDLMNEQFISRPAEPSADLEFDIVNVTTDMETAQFKLEPPAF